MERKWSSYRVMGGLLALAVALLGVSGIPAFKNAEHGWKYAVGAVGWFGFLVVAVALIGLAVRTLVQRGRGRCATA